MKGKRLVVDGFSVGYLTGDLLQITCLNGIDKHRYGPCFSIRFNGYLQAAIQGARVLEVVDYPKNRFYRCPLLGSGHREMTDAGERYLIPLPALVRQLDREESAR